jgi:hypothetical protein
MARGGGWGNWRAQSQRHFERQFQPVVWHVAQAGFQVTDNRFFADPDRPLSRPPT